MIPARPVPRGALIIAAIFLCQSLLVRIALTIQARHDLTADLSLAGVFLGGFLRDAVTALFVVLPWIVIASCVPGKVWPRRAGRIFTITALTLCTALLLFGAVAEWFFWDEFQVRFNFIAVDYLVWTQEVWGNIWESYPMPAIIAALAAGTAAIVAGLCRLGAVRWICSRQEDWRGRAAALLGTTFAAGVVLLAADRTILPPFASQYNAELAKNGLYSLAAAARSMELPYEDFYRVLPQDEAFTRARRLLATPVAPLAGEAPRDLRRTVKAAGPEKRWNVILICMESLDARFMARFRGHRGLTPNLDRIAGESLLFSRLYATGTRTVRGMEALMLGLPPTPGQAIIYRPASTGLITSMTPFLERGYDCAFLYGGDGRFDYMNRFFGGNGARVLDKPSWKEGDITFETSWGACDEDLYRKTISEADSCHAAGKPFHFFCMTTSNHRPFQFPSGKIDLPSDSGRNAAVKYHDYAIGRLIADAATRPWFANTVFVFCSDHCASSAGKMELDVTKFHIPAMVWNPALVPPHEVKAVTSQVDVMPTVFGLLGWSRETRQYGQDVLAPGYARADRRAFISNYQKVALLREGELAVLKTRREFSLYQCDLREGTLTPDDSKTALLDDATAFYQSAAWLYTSGGLKKDAPPPQPLPTQMELQPQPQQKTQGE